MTIIVTNHKTKILIRKKKKKNLIKSVKKKKKFTLNLGFLHYKKIFFNFFKPFFLDFMTIIFQKLFIKNPE